MLPQAAASKTAEARREERGGGRVERERRDRERVGIPRAFWPRAEVFMGKKREQLWGERVGVTIVCAEKGRIFTPIGRKRPKTCLSFA
jgi:hypothetical protein